MRWILYMWERGTGVVMFVCVAIVFMVILQLVTSCRQDLGMAPKPSAQPAAVATQLSASSANPSASQPATSTTNPTPAPSVPVGPTPAEIRAVIQVARDQLVESNMHVTSALKSISTWNSEIPPLLNTAAGDKIAVHEDLLESLTKIVKAERTAEAKLKTDSRRIETLRSELGRRATSSTPQPLTQAEEQEVAELHAVASQADSQWSEALSNARAIRLLADARVEPEKKRTLKEEIEVKAAEEKLALFAEQQRLEKARQEQAAKDRLEQERLAAEREREKERLAAERKAAAEAAAEKQRLEEEALLARARSAEVQSTLAPFLHKRDVQPQKSGGGSIKFVSTFESQPMSLSALKGIGALAPTTDGLKWLARIGGNRKLSGPRWGVYSQPGNWSADDKKLLKEAQKLLTELGPTLVKDGKLSP